MLAKFGPRLRLDWGLGRALFSEGRGRAMTAARIAIAVRFPIAKVLLAGGGGRLSGGRRRDRSN